MSTIMSNSGRLFLPGLEVAPQAGDVVVDLGSGTGTLAVLLKAACPAAEIHGIEPDPRMLALAPEKACAANVRVEVHQRFADDLPFASGFATKVVSSLVVHLTTSIVRPSGRPWTRPIACFGVLASCTFAAGPRPTAR